MAGKRTKVDIIGDMLTSIMDKGGNIKPTHLMYKSNLSHSQMRAYLEELAEKNFITITKTDYESIAITDKGRAFVKKLKEIKDFEKVFGL